MVRPSLIFRNPALQVEEAIWSFGFNISTENRTQDLIGHLNLHSEPDPSGLGKHFVR